MMTWAVKILTKVLVLCYLATLIPEPFTRDVVAEDLLPLNTLTTGFLRNTDVLSELLGVEHEEVHFMFEELHKEWSEISTIYKDAIGWIQIPETDITYPVMLNKDDSNYYLNHNYMGIEDKNGSIFANSTLTEENEVTLLQGHSMYDKSMFGQLLNYKQQQFSEKHNIIYIYHDGIVKEYEVFAVNLLNADKDVIQLEFDNMIERRNYYDSIVAKSLVKLDTYQDILDVLVLSTCSYETNNMRCVVYASKVIRDGERLE